MGGGLAHSYEHIDQKTPEEKKKTRRRVLQLLGNYSILQRATAGGQREVEKRGAKKAAGRCVVPEREEARPSRDVLVSLSSSASEAARHPRQWVGACFFGRGWLQPASPWLRLPSLQSHTEVGCDCSLAAEN